MNKTSKRVLLIALAFYAALSAVIAIIIAIAFSSVNKVQKADFYTMGEDRIPSVKAAIGERDIHSVSKTSENGLVTHTYGFRSDSAESDVLAYSEYLVEQSGFTETSMDSSGIIYAKKSLEEGKIIVITLSYTAFDYTITLQKGKGSLSVL